MRIVSFAAVAQGDVKVAVRSENQCSAVMVPVRLLDSEYFFFAFGIGKVGIFLGNTKSRNHRRARRIGGRIVDEELAILLILWMKGQPEKSFLILTIFIDNTRFNVEKKFCLLDFLIVWKDVNHPLLAGDEVSDWRTSFLIEHHTDPPSYLGQATDTVSDTPRQVSEFVRVGDMGYKSVRGERYKYIQYTDLAGMDELYDLENDPYELENLVESDSAKPILER